ncbi:Protein of unknown function [Gryllus bimaculatus]|nr:Protein of unknown function [Gryllus bimaculatus]
MSLYERFLATEKVIYFANIQKICFMLFRIFIFLLPSMSQICCCTVPEIIENTLKHNKNNLCFERFIQGYKIEEKHTRSMTQLGGPSSRQKKRLGSGRTRKSQGSRATRSKGPGRRLGLEA